MVSSFFKILRTSLFDKQSQFVVGSHKSFNLKFVFKQAKFLTDNINGNEKLYDNLSRY